MAGLSGTLLALLAGALCYLASPRQRLIRAPIHLGVSFAMAAIGLAGAAWLWCVLAGVAAGLCATVCAFAMSLALMPFLGVWWQHEAHRTRPRSSGRSASEQPSSGQHNARHRVHGPASPSARPPAHSDSDAHPSVQGNPQAELR